MPDTPKRFPIAVRAAEVPPRAVQSGYPPDLRVKLGGREKRVLGDVFGLRSFGVNLTRLPPGAASALLHAHTVQDEFVYVLEGTPMLRLGGTETLLAPGMCAGFRGGSGEAHCLVNRSDRDVVYLEIGDRLPGDGATYPEDDLAVEMGPDGKYRYSRKDGTPMTPAPRSAVRRRQAANRRPRVAAGPAPAARA